MLAVSADFSRGLHGSHTGFRLSSFIWIDDGSTVGSGGAKYSHVVWNGSVSPIITVRFIIPASATGSFGASTVNVTAPDWSS